jgi:hypothetical protein
MGAGLAEDVRLAGESTEGRAVQRALSAKKVAQL